MKEVAARWGVCTATVYSLLRTGALAAMRVRRSIRIPAEAVLELEIAR